MSKESKIGSREVINPGTEAQRKEKSFFILIPIFMLIFSFLFDTVLILVEQNRVKITTNNIVTECFTLNVPDYYEKVKTMYEKQKINTELLEVSFDNDVLLIYNSHSYPSFFGKLLGMNSYRVETMVKGYLNGEEVVIEETNYDEEFANY